MKPEILYGMTCLICLSICFTYMCLEELDGIHENNRTLLEEYLYIRYEVDPWRFDPFDDYSSKGEQYVQIILLMVGWFNFLDLLFESNEQTDVKKSLNSCSNNNIHTKIKNVWRKTKCLKNKKRQNKK